MTNRLGEIWRAWQSRRGRAYCTYFDSAYLARGIALLRSLLRHDPSARVLTLALDDTCGEVLRETFRGAVQVVTVERLHARYPELAAIRDERSQWAYYATQKPALTALVMESKPRVTAL